MRSTSNKNDPGWAGSTKGGAGHEGFRTQRFFAGIIAIATPQASVAAGESFQECVDFGILKCGEMIDPADENYSLCILYAIDACYKTHGGGGGGVDPVANSFTAAQQDEFDALVRDLKALRQERARLKDELNRFLFGLFSDAYRPNGPKNPAK